MAKVKKSITRLLAERKALEDRINKATSVPFIGTVKGTRSPTVVGYTGYTVEQISNLFKGNLDKVRSLISYHNRITAALVESNATTKVKIGAEEMTVAAAIERKKSIQFDKRLLATLINQSSQVQSQLDLANRQVEETIERQLINIFGAAEKAKLTAEQRKETEDTIRAQHQQAPIDPNKIAEVAQAEMERISKFETEIDFVLSEINAKTEIELDDETPVA
jgi:hypothetical protein